MAELRTFRTARTRKQCDGDVYNLHMIEPGERYLRTSIPPGSNLGNEHWWTMATCWECLTTCGYTAPREPEGTKYDV
jgi:hypothetical protein